MKLSKHVIDEANNILDREERLPRQIQSAPEYYVSEISDESIIAFAAIKHNDRSYKIGVIDPDLQTPSI